MFNVFASTFLADTGSAVVDNHLRKLSVPVVDERLVPFFEQHGGRSFNQGMYRVIFPANVQHWNERIQATYQNFAGKITCFSVDWLGRVFALDSSRRVNGFPGVVLFEPGTAESLEIPCDLEGFHESELINFREEALAESFYNNWRHSGGAPPKLSECIGYKKPLFLGGADTVENLELSDLDVYWSIIMQVIQKTRGLPLGTKIGNVSVG